MLHFSSYLDPLSYYCHHIPRGTLEQYLNKYVRPSSGVMTRDLIPLVHEKVDNVMYYLYPVDDEIGFPRTYPLGSDFSGWYYYPTFEQPGSGR